MSFDSAEDAGLSWIPSDDVLDGLEAETDSIQTFIRLAVASHVELPVRCIAPGQRLFEDLGITPLGLVLLCLDIEDVKRVVLPFEQLGQVTTVEGLTHFVAVAANLQNRSNGA